MYRTPFSFFRTRPSLRSTSSGLEIRSRRFVSSLFLDGEVLMGFRRGLPDQFFLHSSMTLPLTYDDDEELLKALPAFLGRSDGRTTLARPTFR